MNGALRTDLLQRFVIVLGRDRTSCLRPLLSVCRQICSNFEFGLSSAQLRRVSLTHPRLRARFPVCFPYPFPCLLPQSHPVDGFPRQRQSLNSLLDVASVDIIVPETVADFDARPLLHRRSPR